MKKMSVLFVSVFILVACSSGEQFVPVGVSVDSSLTSGEPTSGDAPSDTSGDQANAGDGAGDQGANGAPGANGDQANNNNPDDTAGQDKGGDKADYADDDSKDSSDVDKCEWEKRICGNHVWRWHERKQWMESSDPLMARKSLRKSEKSDLAKGKLEDFMKKIKEEIEGKMDWEKREASHDVCPRADHSLVSSCAEMAGVPVEKVVVVGNQSSVKIESDKTLLMMVAGNKSSVELNLKPSAGESGSIRGLCLRVLGNEANVKVHIGANVGSVYYLGGGNQSEGEIEILEGGKISNNFSALLFGNESKLNVHGAGEYSCPNAVTKGNGTAVICQK